MEIETDMETERTWKRKRIIHGHGHVHGHGHGHGHGIGKHLLSISYGATVPIAPYEMPLKEHSAISNGVIYL
jgi:hypothetical protein